MWRNERYQYIDDHLDLLTVIGSDTSLKPHAHREGGELYELKGPCPFCGGKERFHVQPNRRLWLCHRCTVGEWKGVMAYAQRRYPSLKLYEIADLLTGGKALPVGRTRAPEPEPAYVPPSAEWQTLARAVSADCERRLWSSAGAEALAWLLNRGLTEATIRAFHLGYNNRPHRVDTAGHYFLDQGITIPCTAAGRMWYLKVRREKYDPNDPQSGDKYNLLTGSRPAALFNADALAGSKEALLCEGEFDAMVAWQELGETLPVVTLGSASYAPDLSAWGPYLQGLRRVLVVYDNDTAGRKGAAALLEILGRRALMGHLPFGKDINDFFLQDGDLRLYTGTVLGRFASLTRIGV